jgi:hypothetical protein
LPEVGILRFAIRHKLRIDLRQRLARSAWLRRSPHDGRDAIDKNAFSGFSVTPHKSSLLATGPDFGACRIAWRRLRSNDRSQTDDDRPDDESPKLISAHNVHSVMKAP